MSLEIHIQPKGPTIKAGNFVPFVYCVICNCLELHPASLIATPSASILQQNGKVNKGRERKAGWHLLLQKNPLWHDVGSSWYLLNSDSFEMKDVSFCHSFPWKSHYPPDWGSHIHHFLYIFFLELSVLFAITDTKFCEWVSCQEIRIDIMLNGSAKMFYPTFPGTGRVYSCFNRGASI